MLPLFWMSLWEKEKEKKVRRSDLEPRESMPSAPATVEMCPYVSGWRPPLSREASLASPAAARASVWAQGRQSQQSPPPPMFIQALDGLVQAAPSWRGPFLTTPRSPASDSLLHFLLRCSGAPKLSANPFLHGTAKHSGRGVQPWMLRPFLSLNPVPCTLQLFREGLSTLKACHHPFTTRQACNNTHTERNTVFK